MKIKKLKGFRDVLPAEGVLWQKVEKTAEQVFGRYGRILGCAGPHGQQAHRDRDRGTDTGASHDIPPPR